jgi:hypothetical protein
MPPVSVHRKASIPSAPNPDPTIADPSGEPPAAQLCCWEPPGRNPRPFMPPDPVQRKASDQSADLLVE